jgi:hypothetical protein
LSCYDELDTEIVLATHEGIIGKIDSKNPPWIKTTNPPREISICRPGDFRARVEIRARAFSTCSCLATPEYACEKCEVNQRVFSSLEGVSFFLPTWDTHT